MMLIQNETVQIESEAVVMERDLKIGESVSNVKIIIKDDLTFNKLVSSLSLCVETAIVIKVIVPAKYLASIL